MRQCSFGLGFVLGTSHTLSSVGAVVSSTITIRVRVRVKVGVRVRVRDAVVLGGFVMCILTLILEDSRFQKLQTAT